MAILISHDPADPSTHTITTIDHEVANLLGPVGAEIAAHVISLMGRVPAIMLAVIPLVWGSGVPASSAAAKEMAAGCDYTGAAADGIFSNDNPG